jgi:hypothetical protein
VSQLHQPIALEIDENNDASSLFSRLGTFGDTARYQELIREEAARGASLRWPLLAELLGAHAQESDLA